MNPNIKPTQWRHQLHMNPELATKEYQTAEFIVEELAGIGVSRIGRLGDTGVVGTVVRDSTAPSVAVRVDADALPIDEQNLFSHDSRRPGAMHAHGHDGHIVTLLGAAALLLKCPNMQPVSRRTRDDDIQLGARRRRPCRGDLSPSGHGSRQVARS